MGCYQGLINRSTVCLWQRKQSRKKKLAFIFHKRCPMAFFCFPDGHVPGPCPVWSTCMDVRTGMVAGKTDSPRFHRYFIDFIGIRTPNSLFFGPDLILTFDLPDLTFILTTSNYISLNLWIFPQKYIFLSQYLSWGPSDTQITHQPTLDQPTLSHNHQGLVHFVKKIFFSSHPQFGSFLLTWLQGHWPLLM